MGVFSALANLFRRTEATPPRMDPSFAPSGLDRPDDDDMLPVVEITVSAGDAVGAEDEGRAPGRRKAGIFGREDISRIDDDLWGVTFAIEYVDAKGDATRRRITLRHMYGSTAGVTYLHCFCHERKAKRTFRFDRVRAVIDMDGVIHEPRAFFRDELRVAVPVGAPAPRPAVVPGPNRARAAAKAKPDLPADRPGMAQRRVARDGLRALVALARADGFLHAEEIEVVLRYIAAKCERAGVPVTDADRDALVGYLRRQRPDGEVLEACLARLEREPIDDQRLLLRSAIALMDADGVQDQAEFALLLDIQQRLETSAGAAQ